MNFAIFPIDKGSHVGEYVAKVIAHIRDSGLEYEFTSMGTIIEAEKPGDLLKIVQEAFEILEPVSDRVYCVMNMDHNKNKTNLLSSKRASVENRIGKVW